LFLGDNRGNRADVEEKKMREIEIQLSSLFDESDDTFIFEFLMKCNVTAELRDIVFQIVSLGVLRVVVCVYSVFCLRGGKKINGYSFEDSFSFDSYYHPSLLSNQSTCISVDQLWTDSTMGISPLKDTVRLVSEMDLSLAIYSFSKVSFCKKEAEEGEDC